MKKKTIALAALILGATVCASVLLTGCKAKEQMQQEVTVAGEETSAREETSAGIHTWQDYLALSPEEREAFFRTFESAEAFEAWADSVRQEENISISLTWDKSGKDPSQYSWEEYTALSNEDQERFYQWFGSAEEFERWMAAVKPEETLPPVKEWDKPGKKPNEYTWEEYQALSDGEKESFYQWFESEDAFQAWANAARSDQHSSEDMKWDKPGKTPDAYTWEEYQNLSGEDQEKFYRWFASRSDFEAWMTSVQPEETLPPVKEWDKPGKTPDEYTWEEYQNLSNIDQEKFYQWFGSEQAFKTWMASVKPEEDTAAVAAWDKPGKTPAEYTWTEYQNLSGEDQEKFFQWFGSVEAFEAWMDAAKRAETSAAATAWNKPGKKPNEYTWEEYEALTPEEQDLFFEWFESVEAFEAWMNTAKGA